MSQKTGGLYRLTQIPNTYEWFQGLLGADQSRRALVAKYLQPRPGERVLDLGCGPATIRPLLGEVDYVGIDANEDHIAQAARTFPGQGTFMAKSFSDVDLNELGEFDLVCCIGLLHHLTDEQVKQLANLAFMALRTSGRLVTVDPVFEEGQHWIARRLAEADSGQCVRYAQAYRQLLLTAFPTCENHVHHDLLRIPYSHCINVATKQSV